MELPNIQTRPVTILWKHKHYVFVKRIIDLTVSLIGLALLSPLLLVVAILVKLDSPGPALFIQTRIGKGGRPFRMYKFRTLQHNVDDSGHRVFMSAFVRGEVKEGETGNAVYKPFRKSQITRLGGLLRQTSIDELPQLVNVLKGEMSLVGPRPNVPWEVEAYKEWHKERLEVLPGITGLAQVNGRSGIGFETIARYDVEYVRRRNLALDIEILCRTVLSVVIGRGAH